MDKMRQWSMLTMVGVVAIMAAGWFLVVSPQQHKAAGLKSQTASQEASNNGLRSQVSQLEQQKKGLPAQQAELAKIAVKIPDNPALPTLIRQLSAAADRAGVDLVSLAPSTPSLVVSTPGTTSSSSSTSSTSSSTSSSSSSLSSTASSASPLAQIPVTIIVQGSYYNALSFFNNAERLGRALRVTGFSGSLADGASSDSSGASKLPPGTLKFQIQAVVFESPEVASQTSPTTAQ